MAEEDIPPGSVSIPLDARASEIASPTVPQSWDLCSVLVVALFVPELYTYSLLYVSSIWGQNYGFHFAICGAAFGLSFSNV